MPDLLQYPVTIQKQTPDAIEDIFDGRLYKKNFCSIENKDPKTYSSVQK